MAGDIYTAAFADDLQRQIEDCIAQAVAQQVMPSFLIGVSVGKAHFEGKKFEALLALLAQYKERIKYVFCIGDTLQKYTRAMLSASKTAEDCAEDAHQKGTQWLTAHRKEIITQLGDTVQFIRWPRETSLSSQPRAALDQILNPQLTSPDEIINALCEQLNSGPGKLLSKIREKLIDGTLADVLADNQQLLIAAKHLAYVDALNQMLTDFLHNKERNILSKNRIGVKVLRNLHPAVDIQRIKDVKEYAKLVSAWISDSATLNDTDKVAALYVVEILRLPTDSDRKYEIDLLNQELSRNKSMPKERAVITILQLKRYQNSLYAALLARNTRLNQRVSNSLKENEQDTFPRLVNQEKAVDYTIRYLHWEMIVFTTNPEFINCDGFVYPGSIGAFEVARLIALPNTTKLRFLEVILVKQEQAQVGPTNSVTSEPNDAEKKRLPRSKVDEFFGSLANIAILSFGYQDGSDVLQRMIANIEANYVVRDPSPVPDRAQVGAPGFWVSVPPDQAGHQEIHNILEQLSGSPPVSRRQSFSPAPMPQ